MTTSAAQAPPSDQAEDQREGLDLSPAKIIASALAAISTAVASSYLGTAGTWIGAGVGSVVATVSTALYHHSLKRTGAKLKTTVVPLAAGLAHREASAPDRHSPGGPAEPPAHEDDPAHADVREPAADRGDSRPRGGSGPKAGGGLGELLHSLRWGRLAAVAGLVFALSIGTILTYELVTNRPVSAQLRGQNVKGTSLTPQHKATSPAAAPHSPQPDAPATAPSAEASPQVNQPSTEASAAPAPSAN
ncbi:MAG: hypothetical protein QOJ50_2428 [Cryptosporangiaceae bacterium]|jgi:hypothetical protein|nr:hypothetical protein [Cryptosporangiaceae bacterium]